MLKNKNIIDSQVINNLTQLNENVNVQKTCLEAMMAKFDQFSLQMDGCFKAQNKQFESLKNNIIDVLSAKLDAMNESRSGLGINNDYQFTNVYIY